MNYPQWLSNHCISKSKSSLLSTGSSQQQRSTSFTSNFNFDGGDDGFYGHGPYGIYHPVKLAAFGNGGGDGGGAGGGGGIKTIRLLLRQLQLVHLIKLYKNK